jgi:hypothetical protein
MINFLKLFESRSCSVLILGMHRSGTSCLAGSLQQNGLFLGKVFEENPHNLKGNRENAMIMELNERLLNYNNGSWDNPPTTISWDKSLSIERDQILKEFKNQHQPIWGFKDPRTLLTFPFWIDPLKDFKCIGTFRNPISVAISLKTRNGMSIDNALNLWAVYNTKLLKLQKERQFPLISFDVKTDEYIEKINKVSGYLNLPNKKNNHENMFFDDSLRNQRYLQIEENLDDNIRLLYNQLTNIYENQK